MAESPRRALRFHWLLASLAVAAVAFYLSWHGGFRSGEPRTQVRPGPFIERVSDQGDHGRQDAGVEQAASGGEVPLEVFYELQTNDRAVFDRAAAVIREGWRPGYMPILIELSRFTRGPLRGWTTDLIADLAGQPFNGELDPVWRWVWSNPYEPHPEYAPFKADLYQIIDSRFGAYFDDHTDNARIRLDEVRWGGVRRDGIPPLKNPQMIAADSDEAGYLDDDNVVFGIELNGDARAYPKRILAWHEMFKDTFGPEGHEISINGVYCTLCGSMIVYDTVFEGEHHELGTSGFLYRSNKLMYDHATESMWSTLTGEPVIGPLVGRGIKLKPLHVVTTTWGEWKKRHPDTTVLSLNTGHRRDYGEGVAYQNYFATDRLMFTVPKIDTRLKNKAEVLALRFADEKAQPTVIAADFLARTPIYHGSLGGTDYVVLTDRSGANRVYESPGVKFETYPAEGHATSKDGRRWTLTEDQLAAPDGQVLNRLSAHRAFWFGWNAAHPDTVLIK